MQHEHLASGLTRRRWLAALGSAGGALALGACGASATSTPVGAPTSVPSGTAQPTMVPVPGSGIVNGPFPGEAKALTGAGATFPAVLYSKWFDEYLRLTNVQVNYQAIGSGGGIKAIQDQTTDFGASDGPMTDDQLKEAKGGEILHVPMTLGATVVTYNLPELPASTKLRFTGDTIAGIFLGTITKWSDPKLKADNPGVTLPDKEIVTVHRSDGSGTTFNFTDYLSAVSVDWKAKVGTSTTVNWPNGLGGKGSEGVTGEVKQTPYAIGYVELIYALQNKLGYGLVKNKAGQFVEPSLEGVSAAAAGAADSAAPDLRISIVNAEGEKSYPISTFTWILAYKTMTDEAKAIALSRLLWWGLHDGQKFSSDLGYAPMPEEMIKKAEDKVKAITVNGKMAFPNK
jgi:phosphate transport system substrate-binding protein